MANIATTASAAIAELREFASFARCEQHYIARSLDLARGRQDPRRLPLRDAAEIASIRSQGRAYRELEALRTRVPSESGLEDLDHFLGCLIPIAAFDLAQDRLGCFSAFRFLYERLLGAQARPFLPSVFCAAAALPQIRPEKRKILLQSISEAAATAPGWSARAPSFFPESLENEGV